jgi:hypothetical protein
MAPIDKWTKLLEASPLWIGGAWLKTGINRYSVLVVTDSSKYIALGREEAKEELRKLNDLDAQIVMMKDTHFHNNRFSVAQEGWEVFYIQDD